MLSMYISSMSCLLLLILLFQIFEYSFEAEAEKQSPWTQRSRIEITFKSPHRSNWAIDHNVRNLFYDYATKNGSTIEEIGLRRTNDCPGLESVRKYEANVMDCHQFQIYLYDLRPQRYCVKTGYVKCNRMASAICLWHTCADKDYQDVISCK